MHSKPHRLLLLPFLFTLLMLAACSGGQQSEAQQVTLAPKSALPADMGDAPTEVKEAYRFAIANKDLLEQIPCFCGCVDVGHTSNYACYVAEDGGPSAILQFDSHALGWGICVDITRDVMKMLPEGKSVEQMREVIIARYGNLGPSTDQ